jgi:hypothetical protein
MRKALAAISVAIAALIGPKAYAESHLWTVQAVDIGQGVACDAFARAADGRAPYEFRFRRDAQGLSLIVSYDGPELKRAVDSAYIATDSLKMNLPAEKTHFGGRNAFITSIDPTSFDLDILDQDTAFVITAGGEVFGLVLFAGNDVASRWRACLKTTHLDLNAQQTADPEPRPLMDEQVGTAGLQYHLRFYFAGFLLRAGEVCTRDMGDFERTSADAINLLDEPELDRLSKAYSATTRQWMAEGANNFNKGVMTSGLDKACAFATTTIRSKVEKILADRRQDSDIQDTSGENQTEESEAP